MGRDLLYKPPTPLVSTDVDKPEVKPGVQPAEKLGVKLPSREIGRVEDPLLRQLLKRALEKSAGLQQQRAPVSQTPVAYQPPAYRSAYFNKDVNSVRDVNLSTRKMQALRGSEGVTDLRKVVLPASYLGNVPNPKFLNEAIQLMGLDADFGPKFEHLLGRQSEFTQDKRVTLESLQARLNQMEEMIATRVMALRRMQQTNTPLRAVSLETAAQSDGNNVDDSMDVAEAGTQLVQQINTQAEALHRHVAKALGIKKPR